MGYTINWDQVSALNRNFHIPQLRDNVFVGNALLMRLKPRIKKRELGKLIVAPIRYGMEGGGGEWYSGTDQHDTTIRNPIKAATFMPKNGIVSLAIDEDEELAATTPDAVLNMMEEKMDTAEETARYQITNAIFNAGTTAKAPTGLQFALPYASTAYIGAQTYGGIACGGSARTSDTNGFWQPFVDSNSGSHYTTGDSGTGTFMQSAYNPVAKMHANIGIYSGSQPSLIVSNWGAWTDFHNSMAKNERYDRPQQNTELAKAGFRSLMYRNAVWLADALSPRGVIAANVENVYLIDESALNIYWDPRRDYFNEPWRKPYNQSTRVSYIKNRLELIFRERRSSGMISVTAAL